MIRNAELAVNIYNTALDIQANLTKVETLTPLPLLSFYPPPLCHFSRLLGKTMGDLGISQT